MTVDFSLPRVRPYNVLGQISAIFCAGLMPLIAIAAALHSPIKDVVVIAHAFRRISPWSASITSSDLGAPQSETSERRKSAARPLIFSAQARAPALLRLSYPRYERARVREGPAYREIQPTHKAAMRSLEPVWI